MSSELRTTPDLTEVGPRTSDSVTQALDTFQGIQSRILRWVLWLLPCFIIPIIIVILLLYYNPTDNPGIVMYISGMVAAALSLFAFHLLMKRIPETFGALWNRKIIVDKSTIALFDANTTDEALSSINNSSNSAQIEMEIEVQYRNYINDLEKLMNSPGQWVMGIFFALLVFTWNYNSVMEYFIEFSIEFFIAFIIGLMAWRMTIAAVKVWQLGRKFHLKPQLGHADGCGGLEPLGNLCLWNALIITIPGIYLGGWIIIGLDFLGANTQYISLAISYTPLFSKLLLVPISFAVISFFLPLLSVHQIMVIWQTEIRRQLDRLDYHIDQMEREILNRADKLEPKEVEMMTMNLELMQQIDQQNQHIPTWPFNGGIMAKFMASQAVPVLGGIIGFR